MTETDKCLSLLNGFGNELKLLWWQMEAWQELFVLEQDKRQPLLRKTAPGFFAIVQVSLAESILMRIGRLMDPPKSCGEENSSLQHFHSALQEASCFAELVVVIQELIDDWKQKDHGPYAALQRLRNKWLAHNDYEQQSTLLPGQLWMPLTNEDFTLARELASRMWSIYRQSSVQLRGMDVVEPSHSTLDNRSAMLLKCLCGGLYLNGLLEADDACQHAQQLQILERQHMGEDGINPIFFEVQRGSV